MATTTTPETPDLVRLVRLGEVFGKYIENPTVTVFSKARADGILKEFYRGRFNGKNSKINHLEEGEMILIPNGISYATRHFYYFFTSEMGPPHMGDPTLMLNELHLLD